MTRSLGRFLRKNLIALLALFLALGGTSLAAANLINGKRIKPNSIPKNRLTKNAIRSLKGNRGPTGPQGPPGTSLFDSVIPSGTTVRGAWGIGEQGYSFSGTSNLFDEVSLPIPAPQRLTADIVNFAAGTPGAEDPDPTCTGSVSNPTAPPGRVCLYLSDLHNSTAVGGFQLTLNDDAERFGFSVAMRNSNSASHIDGRGTWAYTAP